LQPRPERFEVTDNVDTYKKPADGLTDPSGFGFNFTLTPLLVKYKQKDKNQCEYVYFKKGLTPFW